MRIHRSFLRVRAHASQTLRGCSIALLLLLGISAAAQTSDDQELAALRQHLSVDASYKITPGVLTTTGDELRVCIVTGLDVVAARNISASIAEWNKKTGGKYGRLVIVDDLGQADIAIVRYRDTDKIVPVTNTNSKAVPVATWDPVNNKMTTPPVQKTYSTTTAMVPAHGYLLATGPNGARILYRYITLAEAVEMKNNGLLLTETLFKILKDRKKH